MARCAPNAPRTRTPGPILDRFAKSWTEALAAGYDEECTICATPKNSFGKSFDYRYLRGYLRQLPAGSTTASSTIFTDRTITIDGQPANISPSFGYRFTMLRP